MHISDNVCTVPPTRNLTTRASLARYPYASRPRAVESRPRGVESRPRGVESRPRAVESRPRAVESRPRAIESRPRAVESRPRAVESRPRAIESRSRAVESRPARMILNFLSCIFLRNGSHNIYDTVTMPRLNMGASCFKK